MSITFGSLTELIYAANLVNRFKSKYPGVKTFTFSSRVFGTYWGIYNYSTRVVKLDFFKDKVPSVLDADNNIKDNFITYINAVT